MESLTLQQGGSIIGSGDAVGQIQFAAPSESDAGASRYIIGQVYAYAEGAFNASSNPASLIFATSAADNLPASGKIKISHEGHILPLEDNVYDLGSSSERFRHLYVADTVVSPTGELSYLYFDTTVGDVDQVAGQLNWNSEAGSLDLGLTSDLTIHLGQSVLFRVKNSTGSTITKGEAVYASGVLGGGQIIQVAPFVADESIDEVRFIGLMTDDLANGEDGFVNHFGHIKNVDLRTSNTVLNPNAETWNIGDILFVDDSSAGGLTKVQPKDDIYVAFVLADGQNGELFVRITDPGHINQLHDVDTSDVADNNFLVWNSGTDVFEPSSGLYYVDDKLGVGVESPTRTLDVQGSMSIHSTSIPTMEIGFPGAGGQAYVGYTASNQTLNFSAFDGSHWDNIRYKAGSSFAGNHYFYTSSTTSPDVAILKSGRVGISTIGPDQRLHVNDGNIKIENSINPTIEFDDASYVRSKAYYDTSSETFILQHTDADANQLVLTSGNDVGIGTNAPNATLHVYSATSGDNVFNVEGTNGSLFGVTDNLSGVLMSVNTIAGLPVLEVNSDYSVTAGRFNQNDFVISSSGNVGMGTSTPTTKLDVSGVITATGGNSDEWNESYDWINASGVDGSGAANHIAYWSDSNSITYDASQLYWDSSNNRLGIGTASPSYSLDVNGSIILNTTDSYIFGQNTSNYIRFYDPADYIIIEAGGGVRFDTDIILQQSPSAPIYGPSKSFTWMDFYSGTYDGYTYAIRAYRPIVLETGSAIISRTDAEIRIDSNNDSTTSVFKITKDSGTELMRINEAGNLGIGTNSPQQKLHIDNGNVRVENTTPVIEFHDTAAVGADISFVNDGLVLSHADVTGDNQLVIASNSGVGIGTNAPTATLHAYSPVPSSTVFNVEGTNGSLFSVVDNLSGVLMSVNNNAGLPVFEVYDDDSIVAGRFAQNDFIVTTSGDVGVGTANPVSKLEVNGTITANGGDSDEWNEAYDWVSASGGLPFASGTGNAGRVAFWTGSNTLSNDDGIYFDAINNRLGLGGVTLPSYTLHLSGNQFSTGYIYSYTTHTYLAGNIGGGEAAINIGNVSTNGTTSGSAMLRFTQSQGAAGGRIISGRDGTYVNTFSRNSNLQFHTSTNANDTEKMRITSEGNVGINNTSPAYTLDVAGTANITGDVIVGGNVTVNGTTVSANVDTMEVADPILTLGLSSGNIVTNTNLDRGMALALNDGVMGFMGWDTSENEFSLLSSGVASNGSGNYAPGTYGDLHVGKLIVQDDDDTTFTNPGTISLKGNTDRPYISFHGDDGSRVGYLQINKNQGSNIVVEVNQPLHFRTNNDIRMTIKEGGNVGIGTSLPSHKLDVVGNIRATNYVYGDAAFIGNTYLGVNNSDLVINNSKAYSVTFLTNGIEKMRVNSAGNVGIATVTPSYKLDVNGTAGFSSTIYAPNIGAGTDNSVVVLNSAGLLKTDEIDSRVWGSTLADMDDIAYVSGLAVGASGVNGTGSSGQVAFWTGTNDISGESNLYWNQSNDRLGVGTATPSETLHVVGTARVDNLKLDGNAISATDTNGDIRIIPNGIGGFGAGINSSLGGNFAAIGGGCNNNASGNYATIGGGYGHAAVGNRSTISGGYCNRADGYLGTVGGGCCNSAYSSCSTISGGYKNFGCGSSSTVAGGQFNCAIGAYSSIAGGSTNTIQASGTWGFIGGGCSNLICGDNSCYSIITGGQSNLINCCYGFVGGGISNTVARQNGVAVGGAFNCIAGGGFGGIVAGSGNYISGGCSFIGAGQNNCATGGASVIAGGNTNCATGTYSTIGGGQSNLAASLRDTVAGGISNTACGACSFVGGGCLNCARNIFATVGGGLSNDAASNSSTVAGGNNNTASGSCSTVSGGYDNTAIGAWSIISGGRGNYTSNSYSSIGGGYVNCATGYGSVVAGGQANCTIGGRAAILGGGQNCACADYSSVAGGCLNVIQPSGTCGFIGGGCSNLICGDNSCYGVIGGGFDNLVAHCYSTVGGGHTNCATGPISVVAGGQSNRSTGYYSVISGGTNNCSVSSWSTVSGGRLNCANNGYSFVGGGRQNTASNNYASVVGGCNNNVYCCYGFIGGGTLNVASGDYSAIGAGRCNTASGCYSTISGGNSNTASSDYASIGGGASNSISDAYSTIGGGFANATCNGPYTTIGGGLTNTASSYYATVGGGVNNCSTNSASTISGGKNNIASGACSTVGGGFVNCALGNCSTVSGGLRNCATEVNSTIGGGLDNSATGINSSVAGGQANNASGSRSFVGGGYYNCAAFYGTVGGGYNSNATGNYATIGGGRENCAACSYSAVVGGLLNVASGDYSAVVAGSGNIASGACSFIGGGYSNLVSGATSTIAGGYDNCATGDHNAIAGGISNITSGIGSTVAGGRANQATASYPTVAGGFGNRAYGAYSFIGGGCCNYTNNNYSFVGGGCLNCATNTFSTVGGGILNEATGNSSIIAGGNRNIASDYYSSIGGGYSNFAYGYGSTVAGGITNTIQASGTYGFIGGGCSNLICGDGSCYAVIAGGFDNTASHCHATIGGGTLNVASGRCSTIGGGRGNIASDYLSTVGGGRQNCSTFVDSTIGGGQGNLSCGVASTVGGGTGNDATGYYSFVGGGRQNFVNARHGSINGGHFNVIQSPTNECCSRGATIGGGVGHNTSGGSLDGATGDITGTVTCLDAGRFSTISGGFRNCATGTNSTISGGVYNTASENYSTVGGGLSNAASGQYATVGGGYNNTASNYYSVVAGGVSNQAVCPTSSIGGGFSNIACGPRSTIAGGSENLTTGACSTVGGGRLNCACGCYSTSSGGYRAKALGDYSTVSGGCTTSAIGSYSTASGGWANQAKGNCSVVSGGYANIACCGFSTIGGGFDNYSLGNGATIAGGYNNDNYGCYAFIGAGRSNTISGTYSSIIAGCSNNDGGYANVHILGSGITATQADTTYTQNIIADGHLAATTKSFLINHPTRPGHKLQYGSLESPYHGVRLTGRDKITSGWCVVKLPEYIRELVHDNEDVNIQLTNYRHGKTLYVSEVNVAHNEFTVKTDSWFGNDLEFFWSFTATRKDIDPLRVEY